MRVDEPLALAGLFVIMDEGATRADAGNARGWPEAIGRLGQFNYVTHTTIQVLDKPRETVHSALESLPLPGCNGHPRQEMMSSL